MNKKNVKVMMSLAIIIATSLSIWIFADAAFGPEKQEVNIETETNSSLNKEGDYVQQVSITENQDIVMTLEEVAAYNGKSGKPSYVVVHNIVYDMTNVESWNGGNHMGLEAGQDLSAEFEASPHAMSILKNAPVIAKLSVDSLVASTSGKTDEYNNEVMDKDEDKEDSYSDHNVDVLSSASQDTTDLTIDQLATFNGKNGQAAYIAVNGVIYDMTQLGSWTNGSHQGYQAGKDLTAAFSNSPHSQATLDAAIIVGKLVNSVAVNVPLATPEPISTTKTVNETTMTDQQTPAANIWTLDLLAKYNGQNGNPAYIVVNGTIYDVTYLGGWSGGTHKGYSAGQDLTQAFASSPHAMSILNGATIVGTIGGTYQEPVLIDKALLPVGDDEDDDHDDDDDDDEDDDDDDDDGDDDDDHDDD